jgi:hypothetical protein
MDIEKEIINAIDNVTERWKYPWTEKEKAQDAKWDLERSRASFKPPRYNSTYDTMPALPPAPKKGYIVVDGEVKRREDPWKKLRKTRAKRRSSSKKKMPRRRYGKRKRYYTRRRRYGGRRWYGRGAYTMDPGASFGTRWGGYLGSKVGEFGGGWAQRALGLGDYSVKSNVFSGRLPEVTNLAGNGGTIIRFQEYLQDVITSATPGAFKIETFLLNAANEKTLPWLSQIAANYDQFEIQGILFNFRSTSGNALNSTNTALGSVMFATQYDTVDPPFTSKSEMLNYEFSTSSVPSQDQTHMVECDPHQTPLPLLFTESGETNPPNTDPRLYFLGRTAIATTGFQGASVNIGELHVTYQVKLLKPKLHNTLALSNQFERSDSLAGNVFTTAQPFGLQGWNHTGNMNIGVGVNQLYFPSTNVPKRYFCEVWWSGTTGVAITIPTVNGTNGAAVGSGRSAPSNGNTATQMTLSFICNVTPNASIPTVTFTAGVFPTGTNSGTITVCEIPSS